LDLVVGDRLTWSTFAISIAVAMPRLFSSFRTSAISTIGTRAAIIARSLGAWAAIITRSLRAWAAIVTRSLGARAAIVTRALRAWAARISLTLRAWAAVVALTFLSRAAIVARPLRAWAAIAGRPLLLSGRTALTAAALWPAGSFSAPLDVLFLFVHIVVE
jgi:hypothetical protein